LKRLSVGILHERVECVTTNSSGSDGFTHRPWPRAPRNSFLWRRNVN